MAITAQKPYLGDLLVELHVPSFEIAESFYSLLGFTKQWTDPSYMVMRRGRTALCFYGGSETIYGHSFFGRFGQETPRGYGVELLIFVDDVHKMYERIREAVTVVTPLEKRGWGRWDFRITDPFGYYLRISEEFDQIATPGSSGS